MGKPRLFGTRSLYIPNAKADMRYMRKLHQKGRENAARCQYEIPKERMERQLEQEKCR